MLIAPNEIRGIMSRIQTKHGVVEYKSANNIQPLCGSCLLGLFSVGFTHGYSHLITK
jgi:hypothetical protein